MTRIVSELREEIARLQAELTDLVKQRSESVRSLNVRIAELEQRLEAAQRMLTTYMGSSGANGLGSAAGHSDHGAWPELTITDVERVEIPVYLRGHHLRPTSKRAKIIKGTKALLMRKGSANRIEIVAFLKELGIVGNERDPAAYVSVTLSTAKELFETDRGFWSLRHSDKSAG